jgi:hypothetical protein
MPRKHANPDTAHGEVSVKKRKEEIGIPTILPWSGNKNAKIRELISGLSRPENFKVLFGKKEQKEVEYYLFCPFAARAEDGAD